jgi:MYND finger
MHVRGCYCASILIDLTSCMALESTVPSVTDRHAAYFAGWPCSITATATKGRHLIAVRNFARGETVLVSEPYVQALLPSHKKRICAGCMHDGGRRLALHCSGCGEAWYCSAECREADASGAAHQGTLKSNAKGMPLQSSCCTLLPLCHTSCSLHTAMCSVHQLQHGQTLLQGRPPAVTACHVSHTACFAPCSPISVASK